MLWFTATTFLLVVAAAVAQYRTLVTSLASEDDQLLLERLTFAQRGGPIEQEVEVPRGGARGPLVRQLDDACLPIGGVRKLELPPPRCERTADRPPVFRDWHSPAGQEWRIVSLRMPSSPGRATPTWVEVLLDRSLDNAVLRSYRDRLALILGAALIAALVLGAAIARRGLRPLAILAERVGAIDARSLGEPLAAGVAPAEIHALVASFEAMRQRLDAAFKALTEFAGELAHELRTPIHVLRQQAEVALRKARSTEEYRQVLESTLEELDRMRRMVDDTLFLARAEDPRTGVKPEDVSLAVELADVVDFLQANADDRGVMVRCDAPPDVRLSADRMLLRRALVNVLTNALHHTPRGGRVDITARRSEGAVVIDVRDTGDGIPADLLPHIFERHVRGRTRTSDTHPAGAGLGLAIVRGIMSLHGGHTEAQSSGGGTRLTLTFPG